MDGSSFRSLGKDLAKGIAILAVCVFLFGGCCGGVGTWLWNKYSVSVEVKEKKETPHVAE